MDFETYYRGSGSEESKFDNFSTDFEYNYQDLAGQKNESELTSKEDDLFMLMSAGSQSDYSSDYASPNSHETPMNGSSEVFMAKPMKSSIEKLQNNPYFTPNLNSRAFHERNRSEVSELASPAMRSQTTFNTNSLSPQHRHTDSNQQLQESHFDTISAGGALDRIAEASDIDSTDFSKFLEMCDYEASKDNKKEKPKNDYNKVDFSSLGIDIKPQGPELSFGINDSFINELLSSGDPNSGDQLTSKEMMKDINGQFDDDGLENLLPAFDSKNTGFFDPNVLGNLRQPKNRKSLLKQDLDDGDTTIMNNTSILDPSLDKQDAVPDTENLIGELSSNPRSKDQYSPTHVRSNSAARFEMPKLKPFHYKSPSASPSRVEKVNQNYRAIPALNERLSFLGDSSSSVCSSQLLGSPTKSESINSMPGSPIREMYLTRSNQSEGSFLINPMTSPTLGSNHMNFGYYPEQTPPSSPSKAMSGLSLSSPIRSVSSSPTKNGKSFILKPTPHGRKRVATAPRSKTGCWTCRIRHKKCDEARPVCKNCAKISLKCDQYYDPKPSYMSNDEERKQKLAEIAHIWKNRSKKKPDLVMKRQMGDSSRINSESPIVEKRAISAMDDKENFTTVS